MTSTFVFDKFNEKLIDQLYNYSTGRDSELDVNKGLLILGGFGTGKTLILKSWVSLINSFEQKIITSYHSKELTIVLPKIGMDALLKKSLFIDDI